MKKAIIMIALCVLCNPVFSQDTVSSYKYWMTLGAMMEVNNEASLNLNYCFSLGDNFYKVGYLTKGGSILKEYGNSNHKFNTIGNGKYKRRTICSVLRAFY